MDRLSRYTITTDKRKIDVHYVHAFLSNSYWAQNIPLHVVKRSIDGSLCFCVLLDDKQVGFARVITDAATFAYLADVFIDEAHRNIGLSKLLMHAIMQHGQLQGLRRFILATKDAHGLYRQFKFEDLSNSGRWMQIHNPHVYNPCNYR